MTGLTRARPPFWSRSRLAVLGMLAIVVAIFVGANAHLIVVSLSTQPACVPHLKAPEEGAATYRAAMPSC